MKKKDAPKERLSFQPSHMDILVKVGLLLLQQYRQDFLTLCSAENLAGVIRVIWNSAEGYSGQSATKDLDRNSHLNIIEDWKYLT